MHSLQADREQKLYPGATRVLEAVKRETTTGQGSQGHMRPVELDGAHSDKEGVAPKGLEWSCPLSYTLTRETFNAEHMVADQDSTFCPRRKNPALVTLHFGQCPTCYRGNSFTRGLCPRMLVVARFGLLTVMYPSTGNHRTMNPHLML